MIGMARTPDPPPIDANVSDSNVSDSNVSGATEAAVAEAAAELYGVPTDEFTAARNARAKQARDGGNRELAAAITKLPKPTAAAWLANQLVRNAAHELSALLSLGQAMRQATAALDREELRRLTRDQRAAMAALVQRARDLANAAGQRINDPAVQGLEATLHAALADPDAADQLATGRLAGALRSSGFPIGDTDAAVWSAPASAARESAPRPGRTPARDGAATSDRTAAPDRTAPTEPVASRRAQREEQRIRDADAAEAARDEARTALARAEEVVRDAKALVDELRGQLDDAVAAHRQADREERAARVAAEQADRAAQVAARGRDGRA
jgi:hypothetical protein